MSGAYETLEEFDQACAAERKRIAAEDRWWATFNAAVASSTHEDADTRSVVGYARAVAFIAHRFIPESFKGPKP